VFFKEKIKKRVKREGRREMEAHPLPFSLLPGCINYF